jgi:hypothetical protein
VQYETKVHSDLALTDTFWRTSCHFGAKDFTPKGSINILFGVFPVPHGTYGSPRALSDSVQK